MTSQWKILILMVLLYGRFRGTLASIESCPARDNLEQEDCPKETSKYVDCIDVCDGHAVVTKEECNKTQECCFVADRCVLKKGSARYDEISEKKEKDELFSDLKIKFNITPSSPDTAGARDLQIFPGFPGGIPPMLMTDNPSMFGGSSPGTSNCMPFPLNCPTVSLQEIITPPVNIPYCQRDYCSNTDLSLENDMEKCLMHPGCYFDRELHTLRKSFGHQVLPRVPVCHLAIRNHKFFEKTGHAIEKLGKWNPAVTGCIMTQYADEIFSPPKGCDMNDVIEHFGYLPKMAGWTGIQKNECYLINGCWSTTRGCVYPMKMSELFVKSGQSDDIMKTMPISKSQRYGLPKCQDFDSSTPRKFLKSYHKCLSSGCALDPTVTNHYYYYNLWNLTSSLPPQLQYLSWVDIANNNMRADNFEETLNSYQRMSVPSLSSPNPFGTVSNDQVVNLLSTINPASAFYPMSFQFGGNAMARSNLGFPSAFPISSSLQPVVKSVGPDPCPYRQIHMFNFPTLKGRFTGCCERNLCYLPKAHQSLQRSGMSNYFSNWGEWSPCTRSCNGGKSSRSRQCIGRRSGKCKGVTDETKSCNSHPCPQWTQWSPYTPCSVSCGRGNTFRTRECIGKRCHGESRQDVNCNTGKCPSFSNWLHWSPCSVSCGEGILSRTRKCIHNGDYACPKELPTEEKRCRVYCGHIEWSPWSECDMKTCKTTRTPACKFGNGKGFCQDFPRAQSKWCNRLSCYCRKYPSFAYCRSWNRSR